MPVAVRLHSLQGANRRQEDLINQSILLLGAALNHSSFVSEVRNARYTARRFRERGRRPRSISKNRIVEILTGGVERDTPVDHEIDLFINLEALRAPRPGRRGLVGRATTGRQPITTAYWFIDGCVEDGDNIQPARHFIHEWLHIAGFVHYPDNSARGDVPYRVGSIVRGILSREFVSRAKESARMGNLLDEAEDEVEDEAEEGSLSSTP